MAVKDELTKDDFNNEADSVNCGIGVPLIINFSLNFSRF